MRIAIEKEVEHKMNHASGFTQEDIEKIYHKKPTTINRFNSAEEIGHALGGTLYMPAIREDIGALIVSRKFPHLKSMVICLEDSVADDMLHLAEDKLVAHFEYIDSAIKNSELSEDDLPLIFIRIRTPAHLEAMMPRVAQYKKLFVGFAFPKFGVENGKKYIQIIEAENNKSLDLPIYFMPILETTEFIHSEKRRQAFAALDSILKPYRHWIVNLRVGTTDFCSQYGIRKGRDVTNYDILIIRDCLCDIINYFGRSESGYIISGSVWEYFNHSDRLLKPLLRETPFYENQGDLGNDLRRRIVKGNLDGFIKEIILDKENGFIGKTIIHPSHMPYVNGQYIVSYEEYQDSCQIVQDSARGGVLSSVYANKMNEIKPHLLWAKKTLKRAESYGVYKENVDFVSYLITILNN